MAHLVLAHGLIWKDQICVCNLCSFITSRKAVIRVHAERIHGVHNPNKKQVVFVAVVVVVIIIVIIVIMLTMRSRSASNRYPTHLFERVC